VKEIDIAANFRDDTKGEEQIMNIEAALELRNYDISMQISCDIYCN